MITVGLYIALGLMTGSLISMEGRKTGVSHTISTPLTGGNGERGISDV